MITEEQLRRIDELLRAEDVRRRGKEPPFYTSALSGKEDVVPEDLKEHGVVDVLDEKEMYHRNRMRHSRWVVLREEEELFRVVPELYLRATILFGTLEENAVPFWYNGEIRLATRAGGETEPRENKTGFPAGTKEYQKAYYELNKDKARLASKRYQQKQRAIVRAVKSKEPLVALENTSVADLAKRLGVDPSTLKDGAEGGEIK